MAEWKKTGCVLCAQNCGLEVLVEDNRIKKSRPDKDNPRSQGYACRKGLNVSHYQHHAQRLDHPLKRVNGVLERISWEQALDEIAARLRALVEEHGPRCLAYMGGGGQGCHGEAAFGVRLLRGLGSHYHYNALGQELTGQFWVSGRFFGKQYLHYIPDEHQCQLLLAVGWNGWMSHQMPQARRVLQAIAEDPQRLLVVVDPRRSETAARADMHLALRPGSDALLFKAMIALILQEGWQDQAYIEAHLRGFDEIRPWFEGFDARAALEVCGLDYAQVRELCRLLTSRRWALHPDLGVYMGRHSTLVSYLLHLLPAICGVLCVPGGNVLPGHLMPLGSHSGARDARTWRAAATDFPAIMGVFPPNVMPEEIMSDNPQRLRAVICSQSNPLRSYADTTAYEEAFARLELLVTCELALTETAALSHYVLPARSAYESWDASFFAWTWPGVYFQLRRPVLEPEGERREVGWIMTQLAQRLGLLPEIPAALHQAAGGNRLAYGAALMDYARREPAALKALPFVLAQTLGQALGSGNLAAFWGLLMTAPQEFQANAARAGFAPGPAQGEAIFQSLLDHPEGLWIGQCDPQDNWSGLRTGDGRIQVHIPELADWLRGIDAASEAAALAPDPAFPLILCAGRHMDYNANTLMRDPAWNKGKRAGTVALSPQDAASLGLGDGQPVRVTSQAGSETGELEVDQAVRPGTVLIAHGFGLIYQGQKYGVNVNRLTKNTHRDPLAGTPLHRYVPCRVEAA
ncbi:MAG: molybdopterin dinucleotide-binding protein [Desulfarculus sp.]|nr:MAG: molybdopterin dinucleotide-binding protein [Desulfarculus sp.]